ncbi:hypothetical protein JZ751_018858 [Albula glossodonta]|uniref:Uncharacterized protein n=1 Tax=Albula glossodonta TaxID=121402 RepID=A0A8T2N4S0_9TELE|nr:hypothetical protein JZ751_018858 [Albula glossodonta]
MGPSRSIQPLTAGIWSPVSCNTTLSQRSRNVTPMLSRRYHIMGKAVSNLWDTQSLPWILGGS